VASARKPSTSEELRTIQDQGNGVFWSHAKLQGTQHCPHQRVPSIYRHRTTTLHSSGQELMRHLERKTESKALSFSPLSDPTALHPLPLRVYVYIYSASSTNDTLVASLQKGRWLWHLLVKTPHTTFSLSWGSLRWWMNRLTTAPFSHAQVWKPRSSGFSMILQAEKLG
jgi:hypothetical protein